MTYYEVDLKVQHDCPYIEFSRRLPLAVISHWCNWSRDVLEISNADPEDSATRRAIHQLFKRLGVRAIRSVRTGAKVRVVLQHCSCDQLPPPTLPAIEKHNCLNLQPMVYTKGWESYRIVAFSDRDVKLLFRELRRHGHVELAARRSVAEGGIHESLMISTAALLSGLTTRQAHALVAALDHGYFSFPRASTSVEIAKRLGTPRMSFVDHLRKGQNKVILSIGPYLRMRTASGYAA